MAVVSPLVARVHPRFRPRGHRTPYCQTPVRDGPKRAVCYPSIDGSNPSSAGKATRFGPSTGPTVPSGAGAPPAPILPPRGGIGIRPTPRTFRRNTSAHFAWCPHGLLRADHPSSCKRLLLSIVPRRRATDVFVEKTRAPRQSHALSVRRG